MVRFFENFFSQYLLEGNGVFGQKVLKLFLSSIPLTKIAARSKETEDYFSSHYPLDRTGRFERKKMKKASGNYPKAVEIFIFS